MTDNSSIDLSLTNIWRAWRAFRRGKRKSRSITAFEYNLENNLLVLCNDLHGGMYTHGGYSHKIIDEKKRRDIHVAEVRDRVVHRLLYDYLVYAVDKRFDYDVWSCRLGKGLYGAVERTQQLLARHPNAWVWRTDITKFFDHVQHAALQTSLQKHLADPQALRLLDEVIYSYSVRAGQGIPIGNLTSQIFANIYLHEFDRYVRHILKAEAYIRYGDDFLVFGADERTVKTHEHRATCWLKDELGLKVHPHNNVRFPARQGAKFLGHRMYANSHTVNRQNVRRIAQKLSPVTINTYHTMKITRKQRQQLPWQLLRKA